MKETPADSSAPSRAAPEAPPGRELPSKGWSRQRWLTLVVLVFAAQVALIFALGEKKFPAPRAVANVPQFTLANTTNELIALDDPTLFALPRADDFTSKMYANPPPDFRWKEPPGEIPLATENLGAIFARFMRTNSFAAPVLDFKPEPKLSEPVPPLPPMFAENSALRIEGELAQRQLLAPVELPSLPYSDVIAPSKVQALVNEAGSVVSAVLLPPDDRGGIRRTPGCRRHERAPDRPLAAVLAVVAPDGRRVGFRLAHGAAARGQSTRRPVR